MAKEFLGRGWKFPICVDPVTRKIAMSEAENDIRESIRIILSTSIGERVMNIEFGSSLYDFAFETMDTGTMTLLDYRIKEALARWEKRIRNVVVNFDTGTIDEGELIINVEYVICETNAVGNLVYPYYL